MEILWIGIGLMFTLLVLGDALMQIQVRLEEEYLRQTHGEDYQRYCQRTRRWF